VTNADLGPGTSAVDADKKVSVGTLTAMVVGSIVGSGVFVLPAGSAPRPGRWVR
jgi:hypothetical protein